MQLSHTCTDLGVNRYSWIQSPESSSKHIKRTFQALGLFLSHHGRLYITAFSEKNYIILCFLRECVYIYTHIYTVQILVEMRYDEDEACMIYKEPTVW